MRPEDDDDEFKPVWPSVLWATSHGGKTSKTYNLARNLHRRGFLLEIPTLLIKVKWYLVDQFNLCYQGAPPTVIRNTTSLMRAGCTCSIKKVMAASAKALYRLGKKLS
jgi:hypothetical protein